MDKGKYLDSWKEIAAYLGRNIRTCRNWEQDLSLPVHRLDNSPKSHVFAYTGEIDAWREEKGRLTEDREAQGTANESDDAAAASHPPDRETVSVHSSAPTWLIVGLGVASILAIIATALVIQHLRPRQEPPVGRFTIKVEPGHWLEGMRHKVMLESPSRTAIAISGDGKFIVYSAIEENPGPQAKPKLFLRRMDRSEAEPISGTEGGINPFLSPDDRWVGFWAEGQLKKIPVEGGVSNTLCDLSGWLFGADWGRDNSIVFSAEWDHGLSRVSSEGGKPEELSEPDKPKGEISHRLPHHLPDGRSALFTIMREPWDTHPSIALLDLTTRKYRVLLEDAADAVYVPAGFLVFLRGGTLMAVPFDMKGLAVKGRPVPVVADVMQATNMTHALYNTCAGQFCVSDSGCLTYVKGGIVPDMENSLVWVDQRGTAQSIASFKASFHVPRLSPDGQRIAYIDSRGGWRLYVLDLTRGTASPLTGKDKRSNGIWTADGKRLLFGAWTSGKPNLGWQPADESSPMEKLVPNEFVQWPVSLTPDGAVLAFIEEHPDTDADIHLLRLSDRRSTVFMNSRFAEKYPEFSPDGYWLAYSSDESGQDEVYVQPFPGPGGKWKLSLEGGREPLWARNGRQLFYRCQDQVWAMDIESDTGFAPGKPRLLFEKPGYRIATPNRCWDISLDGQRFLMVKMDERKPTPVTEMILVENWFEELKRLVPLGKK